MFDLQLGDIHLVLYNGNATTGDVLIDVYFSAFMGMDLSAASDTLSATMGDPEVYFDVVYPEANTAGAKDTEALLVELVPHTHPTHRCIEIPLPEIDGFAISGVRTNTDGPEDGFLMVQEISSRSSVTSSPETHTDRRRTFLPQARYCPTLSQQVHRDGAPIRVLIPRMVKTRD